MQGLEPALIRRRLRCRGVVQGVGFRPAVLRLARSLGLCGLVRNDADGATIEVQGPATAVAAFERQLPTALPPLAHLAAVEVGELPPEPGATGFEVVATTVGRRGHALVPPDAALCANCRNELDDERDRRHHHPFVTCTDCGPRFSLVRELPYDRERTAMADFPLCPRCAAEYADPASRRCHAEAICCPQCGPRLWLAGPDGAERLGGAQALAAARAALARGAILAVKGLGGFQLACRADDAAAVARLRLRKARPGKPFAVMARDLATAESLVVLGAEDRALLLGPIGPIVLAPRRASAPVVDGVAPGIADLGVMLPTTPLHVELLREAPFAALVATSGNRSDEPICVDNDDARQRLFGIADLFVLHDRPIVRRVDDSVVRSRPGAAPLLVRRSRGYAPAPLALPIAAPVPVLAVGGHLQDTVCVAVGDNAFVSQHVGDLDSEGARAFQREVLAGLEQFLAVVPAVVASDTHPDYPSSWFADELVRARRGRRIAVPHHVAHAAAVLGEHGAFPAPDGTAAALVLDGTGHGPDGAAWGSELLRLHGDLRWSRVACGAPLPLVGGEAAVREPWRLVAAAFARGGATDRLAATPLARLVEPDRLAAVARLSLRAGWPLAHGAGRLFEAAGALFGLCAANDYEGEAAARNEALAAGVPPTAAAALHPWSEVRLTASPSLPQPELLLAAAERLAAGEPAACVARGLHRTFAARWLELAVRELPGLTTLALGGGCFVNRLLVADFTAAAAAAGVTVLLPTRLPPGDGGLAYGQAVVAAAALARATEPRYVP